MTDTSTTETTETPFAKILAETGQPAMVTTVVTNKLDKLYALIIRKNARVLAIQRTKATDPNDTTILDKEWSNAVNAKTAPANVLEIESQYQALIAEEEKLLSQLRDFARTQIKPPLSDAELDKEKKAENEEAKLIADEIGSAQEFAKMADAMLKAAAESKGAKYEGSVWDLMPDVESLKNTRGRKAGAAGGIPIYRTRFDSVTIGGEHVERKRTKGGETITESNLILAAEWWNAKYNAEKFSENGVSDEQLERAMYESQGKAFRDKEGMAREFSFDFSKTIKVQNPNDDSTKEMPVTERIEIVRNTAVAGAAAEAKEKAAEKSTDEKPAEESAKTETVEAKPTEAKPAPTGKGALAAAKQQSK